MFSTRRSVICVALLAFASGCSEGLGPLGGHEPEPVLYPVLSERGHLTYSMKDPPCLPVREGEIGARCWLHGRPRRELLRVRRPNMEAEAMRRQERQEQFRQEQRAFQADQDMRREIERVEREQRRRQEFERQEREREERTNRWRQDDAMRRQRESQSFNDGFRELLRTQEQIRRQQELDDQRRRQELPRQSY